MPFYPLYPYLGFALSALAVAIVGCVVVALIAYALRPKAGA